MQMTLTDGDEREVLVDIDFDMSPYYPAQTYGPPERCSPAEGGEIEINGIEILEIDGERVTQQDQKLIDYLLNIHKNAIDEACFQERMDSNGDQ
jgi:hypothetical protein